MLVLNHVLHTEPGDYPCRYVQTPNVGKGAINPKYIVVHKGYSGVEAKCLDPDNIEKFSTHLLIDDYSVVQFATFTTKVWHSGASYYQGYYGLNGFAIGIHSLAQGTTNIMDEVLEKLVVEYNIRDVVNASDISPDRVTEQDSVDVSRWKRLVNYGNADSTGRFIVVAPNCGVYDGPSEFFETQYRLAAGDGVKVIRIQGSWAMVVFIDKENRARKGWLHESWLQRL